MDAGTLFSVLLNVPQCLFLLIHYKFPLSRRVTSPNCWLSRRQSLSPAPASHSTGSPWQWMQGDSRNNLSPACSDRLQTHNCSWQPLPTSSSCCCHLSPGPQKCFYLASMETSHLGENLTCLLVPRGFPEVLLMSSQDRGWVLLGALHMWLEIWRFPLTSSSSAFGLCSKVVLARIQLRTSCVEPITQNPRITEP